MKPRLLLLAAVLALLVLPASAQARHAPSAVSQPTAWAALARALDRPARAAHAAANTNPATFTDSSNDSGTAPDIRTVVVSNDSAGKYTFRINVASLSLPSNVRIFIFMDTDQNAATGSSGFDYVFVCNEADGSFGLLHWNGSTFVASPASTFSVSDDSTGVTASFAKSDIGNSTAMNFGVVSIDGDTLTAGHSDVAPDSGLWNYAQAAGAALSLSATSAHAPRTVKAGKTFVVAMLASRADTSEPVNDEIGGTTSCRAAIGGRAVKVLASGFIETTSPELAACQLRAPKNAKHKVIRGTITVSLEGAKVSKAFAVRVT